jgi:hypothetical protein
MGDPNTAPAEACPPDPDRDDPDSPALMPEWLAYLIALVILFIIEQFRALGQRHARRPASRPIDRRAPPRDSSQTPAASIDSQSGDVTARPRRGRGVAPECPDLSGARAALLAKLRQANVEPAVWSQLEALGIVPGLTGPDTDTAAATSAPVLSPRCVAKIRRAPRRLAPASSRHRVSPAAWWQVFARPGTGPPAVSGCQSCYV